MSYATCLGCRHGNPHNWWGKCIINGCGCRDYEPNVGLVDETERQVPHETTVMRNPVTEQPIAIPDEIIAEAERPYAAYLDHVAGASWADIARAGKWPSAAAVAGAVKRYLDEGRAVYGDFTKSERLAILTSRLETLYAPQHKKAIDGNTGAATIALNILRTQAALWGLDKPDGSEDTGAAPVTIVISDSEYTQRLKQAGDAASASRNGAPALP